MLKRVLLITTVLAASGCFRGPLFTYIGVCDIHEIQEAEIKEATFEGVDPKRAETEGRKDEREG